MENNSLAMETLILCYIEAKNLLRTKQLDQSDFNKLLIKSCKEFKNYSEEEILSTWRNLVRQYLQVKNNNFEKESCKFYKIMDSCYETSDFHQSGQSKFSDEMVWFLIESLLKKRNHKRPYKIDRIAEVYDEFYEEGYVNLVLQDIQTKWRYMNYRFTRLEGNKEAHLKMPHFAALDAFRKGEKCIKMYFTKSLTEILIRKFTERKVMCNFHGYDNPQLLSEIQYEFQNLYSNCGFDFSCDEIKDKWDKLIHVYEFLKKKHKTESNWVHFQAMKKHFEDNEIETEAIFGNITESISKKRSKSVGEPNKNKKSKLTVFDQFNERSMSPLTTDEGECESTYDSTASIRTQKVENKKNEKMSIENIPNLSEINQKANDTSKKKQTSKIKELKHNHNEESSCVSNNQVNVAKTYNTKKIKNGSVENVSSSPPENQKVNNYVETKKKIKLTVVDQFDERSMSPLTTDEAEKCESTFDSTTSIKTEKVENKHNEEMSIENIPNVSEINQEANDTSKKKQISKIKELKHNHNEDSSCAPNNHIKVAKTSDTKKIKNSSIENVFNSSPENQKVDEYVKTEKKLKANQMKENYISNTLTISLETHATYINSPPDGDINYVEQIDSSELPTIQRSNVHIANGNESSIDKDNVDITINFPSITKKFSGNEFLPLKKRLRLNEDNISSPKEIKDGFRGFSVMDQIHAQSCAQATDFNQLGEEEKLEVMISMPQIDAENNMNYTSEENYEPEESEVSRSPQFNDRFSLPCVVSSKRDDSPLPEQDPNGLSPQPVLLLIIKVGEGNLPLTDGTSYELDKVFSVEEDKEIEGESNSDEVANVNDLHHMADHKYEDYTCQVSTELIETSIVHEPITEVEIRSSECYQKVEMPVQDSFEDVKSEIPMKNSRFVEEATNLPTEKMEFLNQTLATPSEYATSTECNNCPNSNIERNTNVFGSAINHFNNEHSQIQYRNYVEQTECNSDFSSTDILAGNKVAKYKSNLSPPRQSDINQMDTTATAENIKTERKSVRLPVTCGGKLKEIFISPRELSKIAKMKPSSAKHLKTPLMMSNVEKHFSKNNGKNIKFTSQVIKEADVTASKNHNLANGESHETVNESNIIPPVSKVSSSPGIFDRSQHSFVCPDGEYDGSSIISESVVDDEQLSDDLLADIIDDFQGQSNQELKDIKNLIKENNLLQRETNRILRQILEKL